MYGNRESKVKTLPTFRIYTNCRESMAKTFPTFRASTKCREIRKAGRNLSLRSSLALNVGK